MRNEIDGVFSSLRRRGKKALIAYLSAGYPSFREMPRLIEKMERAGVDLLELGVPFSDPIADGPTIQYASQRALEGGATLQKVLKLAKVLKGRTRLPLVVMSYLNPLYAYGLGRFARDARAAGIGGVIVPDLIPEESEEFRGILRRARIHLIRMVAPTSGAKRQKYLLSSAEGFLYAVSIAGVTGARRKFPKETKEWLRRLTRSSKAPVCVGFGISGPEQIRALRGAVDGFIVGSALIEVLRRSPVSKRGDRVAKFIRGLAKECAYGT